MRKILRRIVKVLAYTAASIVILLAIAVGLFRLFLPRVPEYQDEIKEWASAAIGAQVEFSGMDARWGLSGPELEFYEAELIRQSNGSRIVAAAEVRVGVGLIRLLFEQSLVVDRLVIRDTSIDVRQHADGSYRVQGMSVDELLGGRQAHPDAPTSIEVIGEDVELRFLQPGDERPHFFRVPRVRISIDDKRIATDADVRLPEELGDQISVTATQVLTLPANERRWDIIIDSNDLRLPGWSVFAPDDKRFVSGVGDLELAVALANGRISSATADIDFTDVGLTSDAMLSVSGRVEIDVTANDWLVALDDIAIAFDDHEWPESTLRLEASVDQNDSVVMLDIRSSYLNLDDARVIRPWLKESHRDALEGLGVSGEVRNLVATLSEIESDEPRFNVSAELDRVGVAATGKRPGVRGFTGVLRANRSGGRLEINSGDMQIDVPEYFSAPIALRNADGTVIWRSSDQQTTILSDSIALSSEFFHSQSNVQFVLRKDGGSPEIDLASSWSISDIAAAKRYIPEKIMQPKLYEWFQMALVDGAITRGTTSLNGPLDKFPFDGGEGRLLMEASVRNMTFKYHRDWPATEQSDMEVILDNMRLYTEENSSVSSGISVVNAKVNIPDLRDPVLSIESFSTGSLQSIRAFSMASPIAKVFGGQLERVSVAGEASFNLDLTVPLKAERIRDFEFVARVRSNNGSIAIDGFDPPITDLLGEVTISRDEITSEGLGGSFLGEPVSIALQRSEDPQYTVIAAADGTITSAGIVGGLGVPLDGLVEGATPYQARILFPSSKVDTPSPLTIQINTDLDGLTLSLPEPLNKPADVALQIYSDIRFLPGGEIIESAGYAENQYAWQLTFNRPESFWDFDRGVVTFGGEELEIADTRGLHIRGSTGAVRLSDWLSLSRSREKNVGAAERIRSVDLRVQDLFILGQHLEAHQIRVDRSARDWLVQFDGDDVKGSVFVPYEFSGDRAMVLDMETLRLPGDDTTSEVEADIDPRNLPAIELRAEKFAFGDRYLGTVSATLEKVDNGLEAVAISSNDDSFNIVANGRWLADESDPLGSRSFVTATLSSNNVETTMTRLNYQPGIAGEDMSMLFDLSWSGGPRAEFFDVMDGKVQVRLGDGQLREVEPGAGRMFGLMSIVALPRRLSLDFRDVFSKGFGFDEITGTFVIEDGITTTCDLSLEGPAADIGIVGEADLINRTYDQTAIVSANVGNSLPIVGAVVAGPQVAAALLIFSQIFKKPLQEVGQAYYGISGSWDEPDVESTNSEAFVASGELAGCLAEGQ